MTTPKMTADPGQSIWFCGQAWHDPHDWDAPTGHDFLGRVVVEPKTYWCPGKPIPPLVTRADLGLPPLPPDPSAHIRTPSDFPRVPIPDVPAEPEPPTVAQQMREQLNRAVFEVYPSGDLWRIRLRVGVEVVMAGEAYMTERQARDVCRAIRQAVRHSAEIAVQL